MFIICKRDQRFGTLIADTTPATHLTLDIARGECSKLGKANPNVEFIIFQAVEGQINKPVFHTETVRY